MTNDAQQNSEEKFKELPELQLRPSSINSEDLLSMGLEPVLGPVT